MNILFSLIVAIIVLAVAYTCALTFGTQRGASTQTQSVRYK
jgi:hypothetical protein